MATSAPFNNSEGQKPRRSSTASMSIHNLHYVKRPTLECTLSDGSQPGSNNNQSLFSKQAYFRHLTQLRYEQLAQEPQRLESKLATLQRTVSDVYRTQIELVNRLGVQLKGYKSNDHDDITELLSSKLSSKLVTTSSALDKVSHRVDQGEPGAPKLEVLNAEGSPKENQFYATKLQVNSYQTLLSNHYKLQPILNSLNLLAQLIRYKRWMECIKLAHYLTDQQPHFFKSNPSKLVDHFKKSGQNGLNLIAKGLFTDLNSAIESYLGQKTSQAGNGLKKVKTLVRHMIELKPFELIVTEQLISLIIIKKSHNDQKLIASNDIYLNLHLKLNQLFSELIKSTPFGNIFQGVITALNDNLPGFNLDCFNQLNSIRQAYKINHSLLLKLKALGADLKPWLGPLLTQKVLNLAHSLIIAKIENFQSDELDLQENQLWQSELPQVVDLFTNTSPIKLTPSLRHLHNELITIWNELRFLGFLRFRQRLTELVELEFSGLTDWVQDHKLAPIPAPIPAASHSDTSQQYPLYKIIELFFVPYHLSCLRDAIFGEL